MIELDQKAVEKSREAATQRIEAEQRARHAKQAERDRRKAERLDAARVEQATRDAAQREKLVADLRRQFLAAGGTTDEFERVKDDLILDHIKGRVASGNGAMAARYQ